ncbi:hypothetical protein K2173_000615 [Erythroxylum novogranatense]|uniref:Auxilin-related protein 2 n=1 Tax=Erythroxylum novogranatense TaxID=1862640 RepID=A0AAV8S7N9_9ROSI|nr:hypothetical protein K2173_000615 [Erythroxylum novogranatense]
MDDFPGLLARDFGYKPQGKSAPMAPPRGGVGSTHQSSSGPVFDDHDRGADDLLFNDVFGGPPKFSDSRGGGGGVRGDTATTTSSASPTAFNYDSIFKDQNAKSSSLPVFDKPVYDDDIFDGLPGIKTASSSEASSVKVDDVFASIGKSSSPKHKSLNSSSPFDDLLGNLGKGQKQSTRENAKVHKDSPVFDDLLSGFGHSTSPNLSRSGSEFTQTQKPSSNLAKTASSLMEDPFVVLESTSMPSASSGLFSDPLEEIGRFSTSGSTKVDNLSGTRGLFDEIDPLDKLGKSVPPISPKNNERWKDRSPLKSEQRTGGNYSPSIKEMVDKYPVENAEGKSFKKSIEDLQEFHESVFDMPTSDPIHKSASQTVYPPHANVSHEEIFTSSRPEEILESSDDAWLTVSEVPLFTQPTNAPPPSRPPPTRPPRISNSETVSFPSAHSRKKVNDHASFSNSSPYAQSNAGRSSAASQIDELEDFAMGGIHSNNNEHPDTSSGEDAEANFSAAAASAAAMKEAMDKAEAKFRQMREREYLKAGRSKEAAPLERDIQDAQNRELRERQERIERERQHREREEEEREQRRLEKEREKAREIEREENEREQRRLERERERAREIEREKARQAVERATREARERAAAEARLRAERAAVEKAAAEARERAERAAVQRAQAEARERAASEARERAEKAAAEARERANTELRERAARVSAEARMRSERAAVERAAAEARERAAAEARERARANQQKDESDLESFFSSRASSAPRPRTSTSDPFFDTQGKGGAEVPKRTSAVTTANMRKASSTANVIDDLSSIFGAATASSGEFQEIDGESEERRRARLERHQRTQERAAKALAEKNERDLQAQREQAERHRIAESLDAEIRRWAAGKEGNLRALLSTLQYVLWPECGWQPVSLTDLITAAAVKKVYRKANLCIHPDKVQQKGANLQQKYVAEKVFDLLKEAWNKFNSEELF